MPLQTARRDKPASDTEKLDWLRLARTENVGPITFYRLVDRYGSAARALDALPELAKRGGRTKPLTAPPRNIVEREYESLRKIGGDFVISTDPHYPLSLTAIDDAPPVLSILGNIEFLQKQSIAIVGARNASLNGRKYAEKLGRDLGAQGQVVTSGLARGIDTAAHIGALPTGTIAVVAGGIDVVYPEENQKLYDAIKEQGLIVAESALGQKPFAQSFPRRNRIVSGLSTGVVVVEATFRSGSLITARLAGEQGRDVYAVPGHPFDPRAEGPNHLIREGALLVRNAEDLLENIRNFNGRTLRDPSRQEIFHETLYTGDAESSENAQAALLANLSYTPLTVDELIRACHLTIPVVQTALLEMELAGRIKRHAGNRVSLQGDIEF